jgi:hypothetical protein
MIYVAITVIFGVCVVAAYMEYFYIQNIRKAKIYK